MKQPESRVCLAFLFALGAVFLLFQPVLAEDAPPPEQPAAIPAAVPAGDGTSEAGDSETIAEESAPMTAPEPLTLAGEELGALGPPWVYYHVGAGLSTFNQPQDAISEIMNSGVLPSDRTIYFETGTFNGFTINGALGVLNQLQGVEGPGTFPNNTGAATITSDITINNTLKGFTLAGIRVNGDVAFDSNTGSLVLENVYAEGIGVSNHNGSVTFDAVTSQDSGGADIDNTAHASAGVTITNSAFINHPSGTAGLAIATNGAASLTGVVAYNNVNKGLWLTAAKGVVLMHASISDNGGDGAEISTGTSAKITLTDVRSNHNGGDGLHLWTQGDISLTQVTANLNTGNGVSITDGPGKGAKNLTVKDLTASENDKDGAIFNVSGSASLTGVTTHTNGIDGLDMFAGGAITLNGVSSEGEGGFGIQLVNSSATGSPGVMVLDTYLSNRVSNSVNGLRIQSNGSVRVDGLTSEGNYINGIDIVVVTAAGTVTLNRVEANGNRYGIIVISKNTITWKGGGASSNTKPASGEYSGFLGAYLENTGAPSPKAVTLEDVWFFNNGAVGQSGQGLKVESNGAISFKTGAAGNNADSGAILTNDGSSAAAPITLGDVSFDGNAAGGLELNARGAITITNISASWNGARGADLTSPGGAVKLLRTAYGYNDFSGNGDVGLEIDAYGAVTLGRLTASGNGGAGVLVDNCHASAGVCAGYWGVTLTGTSGYLSDFNLNEGDGVQIFSGGAVSLANISANKNDWEGIRIYSGGGAVSLTNFVANENGQNYMPSLNDVHGVDIWNTGRAAPVTLINGQATGNLGGDGIHVESKGAIIVKDIQANVNDGQIINTSPGFTTVEALAPAVWSLGDWITFLRGADPLTIRLALEFNGTMTLFQNGGYVNQVSGGPGELALDYFGGSQNDLFTIVITSSASNQYGSYRVSINDASKTNYSGEGANGLDLRNAGGSGTVTVKSGPVYNAVETSGNSAFGVYVSSSKAVTLTNLEGSSNGGGLFVDNCNLAGSACASMANITLNGSGNTFNGNYQDGLRLVTAGAAAITHIDVYDNRQGYGALINAGSLSINSTSWWLNGFINNHLSGLRAITTGAITLNKVVAEGNHGEDGAYLNNNAAATAKAVLVTSSSFDDNATHGLRVNANGSITLRGVSASGNSAGHGAWLLNAVSSNAPVTVQQSTFDENGGQGLHIETNSNIVWNSTSALDNGSSGGYITAGANSTVTLLSSYGQNDLRLNTVGLYIEGGKTIAINGVRSCENGIGLEINSANATNLTIKNSRFEGNVYEGLKIGNGGQSILLDNVQVCDNARNTATWYAGALLVSNGGKITLQNSTFQGNGDFGLFMNLNGGSYTISKTSTLGNNWDYGNGMDITDDLDVIINP